LTTESPPRSDAQVHTSRTRRLDGESPCVFLDATFEKVRENWRVISIAVLMAVGVRSTGERDVVGIDVGSAEDCTSHSDAFAQLRTATPANNGVKS
jgi:transposase-like protein